MFASTHLTYTAAFEGLGLARARSGEFNTTMARFTEPSTWIAEIEDGNHAVALKGWPIGITGFGVTHTGSGQVCVDGKPVPYERTLGSGFVFAYVQQEWRFAIGRHAGVVKQGMAGVPIWDLWIDGRHIAHAAMDRRNVFRTAGQILLAMALSIAVVPLVIVLVVWLLGLIADSHYPH